MYIALFHTDSDPWALGIRGISSILKQAGHKTLIILVREDADLSNYTFLKEIGRFIEGCDVIGISCLSRGSDRAIKLINYLKPIKKPIIWGGLHATLNPEECTQYADIVCRGEGDEAILDLVEKIENEEDWRSIPNIAYQKNGKVIMNALRPPVADLDNLPVHDFTFANEYHLTSEGIVKVQDASYLSQTGEIVAIGSRGCAFHCTYCCNARIKKLYSGSGRYIRKMSIQKYIEHLRVLLKEYLPNARSLFLVDEDFFSRSLDDIREFSERYPAEIGIPFECCGSPVRINEEKMQLLVKAGLWRIRMGIESGSERTKREIYKRFISNEIVLRATQVIAKFPQVVPYYFFIIANPYEENDDLVQTVQLIMDLSRPFYVQTFNLVFFPGSDLYERALADGLIRGKEDSGHTLDFRAGLHYHGYTWKQKNLYLNALLYLMEGRSTRFRQGLIPRALIPYLIHARFVAFNEQHPGIARAAIGLNHIRLSLRSLGARILKKVLGDPTYVYDLGRVSKEKLKKSFNGLRQETSRAKD